MHRSWLAKAWGWAGSRWLLRAVPRWSRWLHAQGRGGGTVMSRGRGQSTTGFPYHKTVMSLPCVKRGAHSGHREWGTHMYLLHRQQVHAVCGG